MSEKKVLYSWLGNKDIEKGRQKEGEDLHGRILEAFEFAKFDAVRVLSDFGKKDNNDFLNSLPDNLRENIDLIEVKLKKNEKKDYQKIFKITLAALRDRESKNEILYYHVSSGTKPMHTVWVIIAMTCIKGILIESYKEPGKPPEELILPSEIESKFISIDAHEKKLAELVSPAKTKIEGFDEIIGKSSIIRKTIQIAQKYSTFDFLPILIHGETGVGKEVFAQGIHKASKRKGELIVVNCGAIPSSLLDSELFGHEKDAFTGAKKMHKGYIECSDKGTLFLDEIGDLPLGAQVKLLRVIEQKEIKRVGGEEFHRVDLRIIAASHKDLHNETSKGAFREDLSYRLDVLKVAIPPLRARKDDIPLLMDFFLQEFKNKVNSQMESKYFCEDAIKFAIEYTWPGNVRELQYAVIRATINADLDEITQGDLEGAINSPNATNNNFTPNLSKPIKLPEVMASIEKQYIELAFHQTNNRQDAQDLLGLSRVTLKNKIDKYEIKE